MLKDTLGVRPPGAIVEVLGSICHGYWESERTVLGLSHYSADICVLLGFIQKKSSFPGIFITKGIFSNLNNFGPYLPTKQRQWSIFLDGYILKACLQVLDKDILGWVMR